MSNINSLEEIKKNYSEISKKCKETGDPVYITANGKRDLALIDINILDELYARLDLYGKLFKGINDIISNNLIKHEDLFKQFKD